MRIKAGSWGRWSLALAVMALLTAGVARGATEQGQEKAKEKSKGWLGVAIQEIDRDLMESEKLSSTEGVYVIEVAKGSPADKAGIEKGDVILRFGEQDINSARSLTRNVERSEPGESKTVVIERDRHKKDIKVVVGEDKNSDEDVIAEEWEMPDLSDPDAIAPDPPLDPPHAFAFSLGQLSTPRIGVSLYELSDQLADYFGAKDGGVLINEVVKDGPAAKVGLQAGDVIVNVDHRPVGSVADVRQRVQKKHEGDKVTVTVLRRGNEEKTVDVAIEESDTWSGVDRRFFRANPRAARPLPREDDFARRETRRALRDAMQAHGASQMDLRQEVAKLREEMDALKKQLKEKGK